MATQEFFPTPKDIAEQMISYLPALSANAKVLEPSAGDGALIKAFRAAYPNTIVDCFELMDLNRKKLASVDGVNLFAMEDFLKAVSFDEGMDAHLLINSYDAIIANPPFTNNQDIDHIYAMYKCLKPGGTLITLCSSGWTFGSHKKQIEFKQWLEDLEVFPLTLADKSFVSFGTGITPLLLQIQKSTVTEAVYGKAVMDEPAVGENHFSGIMDHLKERGMILRTCRLCGCTDNDCKQCIEKTGKSCHWVEEDLCSACQTSPQESQTILNEPIPEPVDIINQMKEQEKDTSNFYVEQQQMISSDKQLDMNFFKQLFDLMDGIDVNMHFKRINGQLELRVIPETGATLKPVEIKGTPEDFDQDFFKVIQAPVERFKGLKIEMDEFHKSAVAAKEEASKESEVKSADKPTAAKPAKDKKAPDAKKAVKKTEKKEEKQKVIEPSLFD